MESIGSALAEPFRLLLECIYARIKNLLEIRSNYKDLERDIAFVSGLKLELEKSLSDDQLRHLLPTIRVKHWLSRAEELKNNFESVRSTATESGITSDGDGDGDGDGYAATSSSCSCCSRSSLHFKLSNNIAKQIVKAKQLVADGKSFEDIIVGVPAAPEPAQEIGGLSIKASKDLDKIMDVLINEDDMKIIGVWGMGGVGKTTLVRKVNDHLYQNPTNHPFSIIIYVLVSQSASVESVQTKIAERLHLQMDKELSTEAKALRLRNKLKGERFLLILDDVWKDINLDEVGIPQPKDYPGTKIIVATREYSVCQQMQVDKFFEMGPLQPKEAWELFSQTVGEEVEKDDQIKQHAKEIVEECGGLPLALITVGRSLRNKEDIAIWRSALHALKNSEPAHIKGVEEKVYRSLKWSYDSLTDKNLKSCFLFFCLFPEDFEVHIDSLVQYWLSEGLLDEKLSYEKLYYRCVNIVESLKDSCLLEKGSYQGSVKMHDVVRDVGIWIASSASTEDECKSIIRAGVGETHISQTHLLNCSNRVMRVSLMKNKIASLAKYKVQCLDTSTLFLQGNESLQDVPCSFLEAFQKLRILDLGGSKIKSLPKSLLQLTELRALLLKCCDELLELPSLATLGKLQVLDCKGTALTKLPDDFEKLTNLRQLDLSSTRKLSKFPMCMDFSNLGNLEFLAMLESGFKWGTGKTNEELENVAAAFEQLLCLDQLVKFYVELKDVPRDVSDEHVCWIRRMSDFIVYVSPSGKELTLAQNRTNLVFFADIHFTGEETVGWLLENAFNFRIRECKGVDLMLGKLVINRLSIGPFAKLKSLFIENLCISVELEISSVADFDLLPNLEELHLQKLSGLTSISDLSNSLGFRFTKLKTIWLSSCAQFENLLTLDNGIMPQKLENLEQVQIQSCEKFTTIFKNNYASSAHNNFVPNLKLLRLSNLPKLEGEEEICKADDVSWQSLKELSVRKCDKLHKLPLGIQTAESIQLIRGEQDWWEKLQWDNQNLKIRLQSHFKSWPVVLNQKTL